MRKFVLFLLFISTVMLFGCGDFGGRAPLPDMETPTAEPPKDVERIPGGRFRMGSDDAEAFANEKPVKFVYIDDFYIDAYEVTNAEYLKFIESDDGRGWEKEGHNALKLADENYLKHWPENKKFPDGKDNHPVVYVSWHAANAYAISVGKRLPTEAEWEKAARGTLIDKKYSWGDSIDKTQANYGLNVGNTVPVGQYAPNDYGLYDMVGNVWEWCSDPYESDDNSRVLRGGSWFDTARFVRVSIRGWSSPSFTSDHLGFRCAWPPNP